LKASSFKIFIVFIIVSVLGVFVIPKLSIKLNPSHTLASITVSYTWQNSSPYNLERDITSVLEASFSTLRGLKNVNSKSSNGNGYITLEFDRYTNIDIARFETATIIRQLYKQLPEQSSYPIISVNRPDENDSRAFLSYSINAPTTSFDIQERIKTDIEPIIGMLKGIDRTMVYGANPKEYVLHYNSDGLKKLQLTKQDIINALSNTFDNKTLGEIFYHQDYITLSIQPDINIVNWHIPVKKIDSRIVFLDELTTIKQQEKHPTNYYRINGKNAITMAFYSTKDANTITLAKNVHEELQELKTSLPESYSIVKTYDSTEYLQTELDKIYERGIYTLIILLLFIYLVSRSLKYLLVILISIVANISIAFLLYYIFNVELQLYSLAGIAISFGLIIDVSIVMIDHMRHQNNRGAFVPILASTLTTIGALSIIYFLDNKYKVNLIDFALVIIINLSVSLVIALFLIPGLLEKIKLPLKLEKSWSKQIKVRFYKIYSIIISFLVKYKKLAILFIILAFGTPLFMFPQQLEQNDTWYEKTYNNTLGNEWYRENVRPYLDRYLGGSLRLFSNYVFENAYYGRNEDTKLYVSAAMEKGATIDQMNEVFLELENYVNQFSEIKQFTTNVSSSNLGRMEITFKEGISESSFPFVLKSRLIRKAIDFGGIEWNIYGVGNGFNNVSGISDPVNFTVKAKGYNYNILNQWADSLKISLEEHPRIQNVTIKENSYWSGKPAFEYRFLLDKERLAVTNVSPSTLITELKQSTLLAYQDIALNIKGVYTPIRLVSDTSKEFDIWHINNIPLDSLNNPIVLKDIATITKEREEENIYKENQEYLRLVQFQYTGSAKFGSEYLNKKLDELNTKLPLGFSFETSSQSWFFNADKNSNYMFLLVLVLSIIFLICAILFESLKQPFIILSIIPISFIGVFLTFYLFDFNFDQGGLASFVLLSGITVNASIFILNGYNMLKKEHLTTNSIDLYLIAFKQKIFPIMLTIISTILGFIPFVKDGQNEVFWFALGVGTIGGLLFSLLGILFYLPLFTLRKQSQI